MEREGWVLGPKPWGSSSPLPEGLHPLPSVFAAGGPLGLRAPALGSFLLVPKLQEGNGLLGGGQDRQTLLGEDCQSRVDHSLGPHPAVEVRLQSVNPSI